MKLLFPYAQLSFIGWVVWVSNAPQWQTVIALLLLAWAALGITMLRLALIAMSRAFVSQHDAAKLLSRVADDVFPKITKPRRR